MLKVLLLLLLLLPLGGCFFPTQQQVQLAPESEEAAPLVLSGEAVTDSLVSPAGLSAPVPAEVSQAILTAALDLQAIPAVEAPEPQKLPYSGDFPLSDHPRIDKLYNYYTGNGHKMFGRWLERAGRYIPMIQEVFVSEGVPKDLAYLALIESGFNAKAYSWAHAAGPWQFIESTAKLYGMKNDWWRDDRCDIEKSTHAAARHLKYLHDRFDGNWYLAVAAYNAGGGKVRKAVRERGSRDFWQLVEGKVLREETRNYLPKLLATLKIVKDLPGHGFADLDFEEPLVYDVVTIPSSTDLEIVARFCDVGYAEIKELNPALKRWSTPPGVRDFQLKIPADKASQFEQLYAELPKERRASYHRHQIRPGDTLGRLAKKYHIQIDDIITLNSIKNPRALQVGKDLIMPLQENFTSLPVDSLADNYQRSYRRTYTVRSGDSLWKIANRFSVTQKQLRVWNRLGWSNLLRPGQKLAVSKPGKGKTRVAQKNGPSKKVVYQVLPGDTLWGIGRQFDVETEMIRLWNDLNNSHVLRPGQKLTLMVTASRQG